MATIYRMSQGDDESTTADQYGELVGEDGIKAGRRVRSSDYGKGTILGLTYNGVTVHWDDALSGTHTHILDHDRRFVAELERLE